MKDVMLEYSLILNLCNHQLLNMSSRYEYHSDGHISMAHYSCSDPLLILNVEHCVSIVMGIHVVIYHLHYVAHDKA